jgi:hypothetical protein
MDALFVHDGVEFIRPDMPRQRVAHLVRCNGRTFFVCDEVGEQEPWSDVVARLVEQAKARARHISAGEVIRSNGRPETGLGPHRRGETI